MWFWIGFAIALYVIAGLTFLLTWNHRRDLKLGDIIVFVVIFGLACWPFIAALDSAYGSLQRDREVRR